MPQPVHVDENEVRALDGVADRFLGAIEKGDIETIRELYSPDFTIWHNFTDQDASADEHLAVLRWISDNVAGLRFENVRRWFLPGAFLQQHVVQGRDDQGNEINCPAILKVDVRDRQIMRIEEYFDPGQMPDVAID